MLWMLSDVRTTERRIAIFSYCRYFLIISITLPFIENTLIISTGEEADSINLDNIIISGADSDSSSPNVSPNAPSIASGLLMNPGTPSSPDNSYLLVGYMT